MPPTSMSASKRHLPRNVLPTLAAAPIVSSIPERCAMTGHTHVPYPAIGRSAPRYVDAGPVSPGFLASALGELPVQHRSSVRALGLHDRHLAAVLADPP